MRTDISCELSLKLSLFCDQVLLLVLLIIRRKHLKSVCVKCLYFQLKEFVKLVMKSLLSVEMFHSCLQPVPVRVGRPDSVRALRRLEYSI